MSHLRRRGATTLALFSVCAALLMAACVQTAGARPARMAVTSARPVSDSANDAPRDGSRRPQGPRLAATMQASGVTLPARRSFAPAATTAATS